MKKTTVMVCCALLFQDCFLSIASAGENWPQWRGPLCNGLVTEGNPPIEWSEEKNIKWKVEIPGTGNATPAVWGDKVFVLTAKPAEGALESETTGPEGPVGEDRPQQGLREGMRRPNGMQRGGVQQGGGRRRGFGRPFGGGPSKAVKTRFLAICLDLKTGKALWQKTAIEATPHESHHADGDYASFSPVTDGENLYAFFGSQGVFCYDLDGNLRWKKDLGDMNIVMQFGEGGSPTLLGNTLFINFDHEGDSFLVALDKSTGDEIWRVARDEGTSWSTPMVVTSGNKTQLVVAATGAVRAYDPKSGDVLWKCSGQTRNVVPTPVAGFGMVFATSGFRGSALHAIELGREGDLTDTDAVRWSLSRGTPYVPSPLLYDDKLYLLDVNRAVLSCYQAESGEANFVRQRLDGLTSIYASPVGIADRVYFVGRDGTAVVIRKSAKLEILAQNQLDDRFDASPVVVGDQLLLRGKRNLYCVGR